MGTTIWIDDKMREELRRLQRELGTKSANDTLRRIVEQPASDARSLFARHHKQIRRILKRHQLRRLVAFGSRARGDARITSDLDLAAEARPGAAPLSILAAEAELEAVLGVHVNLVELPNARLAAALKREGVAFESG